MNSTQWDSPLIWQRNQKLSRQAKLKRIQHHQTSFTTNAKGTTLGRKHKRRKDLQKINPKQFKKTVTGSYISIITLNENGLNAPTKRHRLAGRMQTCAGMHLHLPHHSAWPQVVCNYFMLLCSLIMFPLWLAIAIIFHFLSGYWLWKLINIFYYCDYVTIIHLIPLYHDGSTENNRILYH